MRVDGKVLKRLANAADIINTVNGGTVFPRFNTIKEEDHYRLDVVVPTVNPEDLKVEVSNSDLLVYQNVHLNASTLPNILGILKLSPDVILDNISAAFEDNHLTVILPINELPGGFNREIDIHRPI